MADSKPRIALIARNDLQRGILAAGFAGQGAEVRDFESLEAFRAGCGTLHFSGVAIDLKTLLSSTSEEKSFLAMIEASFPLLRIIQRSDGGQITAAAEGLNLEGAEVFERFVRERCLPFRMRGVRLLRRQRIHLGVRLLAPRGDELLTNTWDVSTDGLFIICSHPPKPGKQVEFILREFEDHAPLRAEVRWKIDWGTSLEHLPGFGARFTELSQSQVAEIHRRFGPASNLPGPLSLD